MPIRRTRAAPRASAKADLVSEMVGEFPELQGLMGRYYAEHVGTKPEIARAIELHYKPKGPTDIVPREDQGDAVAVAVALADKLDTLVGFWAIDEKPTGSGDPYQLRRAALGVIRIVLENDLRVPILGVLETATTLVEKSMHTLALAQAKKKSGDMFVAHGIALVDWSGKKVSANSVDLLSFFADRLKVFLRDQGKRHDLIDAVFALGGQDDLALIVRRVEALDAFLKTDDGTNLLAGVKRAANILAIEEKKDKKSYAGPYELALLKEKEETALAAAIEAVKQDTVAAINVENFAGAMRALCGTARAGRSVLRENSRQRRRSENSRKPPAALIRNPRRNAHRRRLLKNQRLASPIVLQRHPCAGRDPDRPRHNEF